MFVQTAAQVCTEGGSTSATNCGRFNIVAASSGWSIRLLHYCSRLLCDVRASRRSGTATPTRRMLFSSWIWLAWGSHSEAAMVGLRCWVDFYNNSNPPFLNCFSVNLKCRHRTRVDYGRRVFDDDVTGYYATLLLLLLTVAMHNTTLLLAHPM